MSKSAEEEIQVQHPATLSWVPKNNNKSANVDCLCLGTGRFLRSVLMPALVNAGFHPALVQPRGRSMIDYMHSNNVVQKSSSSYEVDTVLSDGTVETLHIPCYGVYSLGTEETRRVVYQDLLPNLSKTQPLSILGVGVTEAGLASSSTPVMRNLYDLLKHIRRQQTHLFPDLNDDDNDDPKKKKKHQKLCVVNMDNVPHNGQVLRRHMMELANHDDDDDDNDNDNMRHFMERHVVFLNTMVDRITSQRPGSNGMVPRCEPVPQKALVILDPHHDLPPSFVQIANNNSNDNNHLGVWIRPTPFQLEADMALKLRVANGTHTAMAHAMALCKIMKTNVLANDSSSNASTSTTSEQQRGDLFLSYLDSLFQHDVLPAASVLYGEEETAGVYNDWRRRLCHEHFGLSTFFITQNGAAKGGIRLGPTVATMNESANSNKCTVAVAFAFAALLRWLTPCNVAQATAAATRKDGVYRGWLEGTSPQQAQQSYATTKGEEYADGLRYDLEAGWYEFKCACCVDGRPLSEWLAQLSSSSNVGPRQPFSYNDVIRAYLVASDGGNLSTNLPGLNVLVQAVATLYARMVVGDGILHLLEEMKKCSGPYVNGFATNCNALVDGASLANGRPLPFRANPVPDSSMLLQRPVTVDDLESVIVSEVASVRVVDLHTHLLPPSHGSLCCWGIDELLTYHYLVAEYFITAPPSMTPESFYAMNKQEQADIIWKALFIDRSPVSEACRGVITTLQALGLQEYVQPRDLEGIRNYYRDFRDRGLEGAEAFSDLVYKTSGVQYAIMTNIPFEANEAQYWRPARKEYSKRYRSALRVDPLLAGDRATVETALRASGYDVTLEGARQYLRDWCDTMKPEYMMASTPHYMVMPEGSLADAFSTNRGGVNMDAMKEPFAFVDMTSANSEDAMNCNPEEDNTASVIDENSDFLSDVLMKVCEERDLPVALKIGAHRGVNPRLQTAGDGVVAFADTSVLARLCSRFPKVRFLATFLSRNNQHEACVLASKFRNLHIYGCWWYCNNPSMIKEITTMRIEMLGTAFTAQHSDARVLDQLIYKWSHSRAVIASVLVNEYAKLCESGWTLRTRTEVRRDVQRLFGRSYEDFMSKSFAAK